MLNIVLCISSLKFATDIDFFLYSPAFSPWTGPTGSLPWLEVIPEVLPETTILDWMASRAIDESTWRGPWWVCNFLSFHFPSHPYDVNWEASSFAASVIASLVFFFFFILRGVLWIWIQIPYFFKESELNSESWLESESRSFRPYFLIYSLK